MKIPTFIIELIQRVATKNPKFFQVIQAISATVAFVAFIPDLCAYLDIASPSWLELLHDKAIKIGALTAVIMAQLPNEQPQNK
jgi:xanthine/uracil permease